MRRLKSIGSDTDLLKDTAGYSGVSDLTKQFLIIPGNCRGTILENKSIIGMVTNGSSHLFIKTLRKQYGISDLFSTRSQYRSNLFEVLKILKYCGFLIIN